MSNVKLIKLQLKPQESTMVSAANVDGESSICSRNVSLDARTEHNC